MGVRVEGRGRRGTIGGRWSGCGLEGDLYGKVGAGGGGRGVRWAGGRWEKNAAGTERGRSGGRGPGATHRDWERLERRRETRAKRAANGHVRDERAGSKGAKRDRSLL